MDHTSKSDAPPVASAWNQQAQTALIVILTAALFFMLGRSQQAVPTTPAAPRVVDLNQANVRELHLLPGVGRELAQRIVEHRDEHGPFRRVDDLREVSGVGPKTLDRLRPALGVPGAMDDGDAGPAAKASRKPVPEPASVNINEATVAELQKLPGIGPKLAQRIADERSLRGPFKAVDALRRVSGIGAKTLDKVRPYVCVERPGAAIISSAAAQASVQ